ncbi:MAG: hypothetical protein U0R26_00215 [Solirubrobacterales bacterium]
MNQRHLLLPCLVVTSAFLLVACGGGGKSDEDQITEAIETSATSTDPADCTKFATQNFLEQNTQESGPAAAKTCEEEAGEPESSAESAAVSKVEVEGSKARADVALTGGGFDGQAVTVALVKEGDQWMLNEITGFAKFNRAKLVETFESRFSESSEINEKTVICFTEALEGASESEIEELLLSGSSAPLEELAEACS